MAGRRRDLRFWVAAVGGLLLTIAIIAAAIWRDDIVKALLDPKVPFVKTEPPKPPDYSRRNAWALAPETLSAAGRPPVDVFFVHPTTYNGGRRWNGPIPDHPANEVLARVMLPNYAGPFAS